MSSREAAVTKIPAEPRSPFDFPPVTDKVTYLGIDYTFRELSVGETDDAREMSIDGDEFDGRLMTRLMITTSSLEPKITLELLTKLPQSLYSAIVDCVNELNDPELLKKDAEPGNS